MEVRDLTKNANTIEAEVIELLAHRVPADINVTAETQIVGGLGLDSVAVPGFIMDVEDRFNNSIPLHPAGAVPTNSQLSPTIAPVQRAVGLLRRVWNLMYFAAPSK